MNIWKRIENDWNILQYKMSIYLISVKLRNSIRPVNKTSLMNDLSANRSFEFFIVHQRYLATKTISNISVVPSVLFNGN